MTTKVIRLPIMQILLNNVFLSMSGSSLLPSRLCDSWCPRIVRLQPDQVSLKIRGSSGVGSFWSCWVLRCWWGAWLPLLTMFPELWEIGTLTSVFIIFQRYRRTYFPIAKAGLETHQAREFFAWLNRSIGRSRERACLFHANKMGLNGIGWMK